MQGCGVRQNINDSGCFFLEPLKYFRKISLTRLPTTLTSMQ